MRFSAYIAPLLFMSLMVSCAMSQAERDEQHLLLSSNCHDDNLRDRCDPESQRQVRALYNARPIEELAADGWQIRRVFYVDGYGRDMPMVSFERAPGDDPRVAVYAPLLEEDGSTRVVELAAEVPLSDWNEIILATQDFDRQPVPVGPQDNGVISMCLHSWVVTMEASDPFNEDPTRQRTEDACNRGRAIEAAFNLAQRAYALLPACNALRRDQYRNEIALFWACALLEGNRLAAAEALNQATSLDRARHGTTPDLIHDDAQLHWMGEQSASGLDVHEAWMRFMGNQNVLFERAVGESAEQARLFGSIDEWDHSETPRFRIARVEQLWVRENGSDFRMKQVSVSPWGEWETP